MKTKRIISWLIVLSIMIIIFYFSNQKSEVSSGTSSGLAKEVFDLLELDNVFEFDNFHIFIRKFAHFSIYFLLGLSIYNALSMTVKIDYIKIFIVTILCVFMYACSDEIHQLFVSGRSCEFRDIMIDTIGGSVGSFIYYFYLKIKNGIDMKEKV